MNTKDLKKKMLELGIPSNLYKLDDEGISDQKMCLTHEKNKWYVFYSEKGQKFDTIEFDSEDDACQEMLRRLS